MLNEVVEVPTEVAKVPTKVVKASKPKPELKGGEGFKIPRMAKRQVHV